MKSVVTSAQMRCMDQMTVESYLIPGVILMENAGRGVAQLIWDLYSQQVFQVVIFCGKGNNGGDGFVIARHLRQAGLYVDVVLVGKKTEVKGDAQINLAIVEKMGIPLIELTDSNLLNEVSCGDLIVDAVLGTGITGPVRGLASDVIEFINQCPVPVVSVDIPSGLNSDTGHFEGVCVQATQTATMAALKRGLLLPPGRLMAGEVTVIDISMPEAVHEAIPDLCHLLEPDDVLCRLPDRPVDGHKGTFGKVGVVAGSRGMTGAATLSSMSAFRTGAGLVTCACPASINGILETKMTEVMTRPLDETSSGTLAKAALSGILELFQWADVAAIGPGLSMHEETADLIRQLLQSTKIPFVLDADGLNAFHGRMDLLKQIKTPGILTPHVGELARLIDQPMDVILNYPIETARETAQLLDKIIVLKGAPSIIAEPNGGCFINSTGNSGMATGGAGDVLTGIIAGLMAQGCSPLDAAFCGVYLHGLAGDLAAEALDEHAMLADDISQYIGNAYQALEVL